MSKRIIPILYLLIIWGCTKDCNQWYSRIELHPVTKKPQSNSEVIEGWNKTDNFEKELNFLINFIYSADGYEGCKSKTMIHEIVKDSTLIFSSSEVVIGGDTVPSKSNLYDYFILKEFNGHYILEYNKARYPFPTFEMPFNKFFVELLLTDSKTLIDSAVVTVEQ